MKFLIGLVACVCFVPPAVAQQVVYVQEARMVPVVHQTQQVQYAQERQTQQVQYISPSQEREIEYIGPERHDSQRQNYIDVGRRRDFGGFGGFGGRDCDRGYCKTDRCFDVCPEDLFLQCACGSFVLRNDGTGVATYKFRGCVRGGEMKQINKDAAFVYYAELGSDTQWAFSRSCYATGHTVFRSKQQRNPLDCDWEHFCYAPPSNYCDRPRCNTTIYDGFNPYLGR